MKKLLFVLLAAGLAYYGGVERGWLPDVRQPAATRTDGGDALLASALEQRWNNYQVQGGGTVVKLLPDDEVGSRHQRFIVRLASGQTLLVAHNIDLAPRIDALRAGDPIEFNGEYEWNAQGGVIHWTHHDPRGRHEAGWIRHGGRLYQ